MAGSWALQKLVQDRKKETRILGDIKWHLMQRQRPERRTDIIHPSEMARADWCPRATYYRMAETPIPVEKNPSINMEMAFEDGHDIHRKWQGWLWEMGVLEGMWRCTACKWYWADKSPRRCPNCNAFRGAIRYAEVPLESPKFLIAGHADAHVRDDLMEFKSIGTGTLRFEAPHLLRRYESDMDLIWRNIHRPFPAHLRQGMIYLFLSGLKTMVFIYDFKAAPKEPKEFVIKYRHEIIEDLLDACLEIKYGLKKGRPPARPIWAKNKESRICKSCPYRDVCYAGEAQPQLGTGRTIARRPSRDAQGRARSSASA